MMDLDRMTRRSVLAGLLSVGACATTPPRAAADTTLVNGRNGTIEVLSAGPVDALAVVMIPSLGRGAEDFQRLAGAVAEAGMRALCPQPRGFGRSARYRDGVKLDDLADDVADVIAALTPRRRAVVLGHAFGNRVARMCAARRPDLVRAVILLAAGGKVAMPPDIERSLLASFDFSLPDTERMAHVAKAFFAPGNDPTVWRDGWRRDIAEAQINATRRTPVESWWAAGQAPILVVQPLQDVLAPPENTEILKASAPGRVEVVGIDRAGHALLPEQPDQVAAVVIAFAKRQAGQI